MGTANEQIRVSDTVKRELERRRRDGESYNDVLERVFGDEDRDILAGFGRWSEDHADRVRERYETAKQKSKERTDRPTENE